MIWLKRLLPFLILAAAWYGYSYYSEQQLTGEVSRARQVAEVSARVWIAGIEHRADSSAFLAFRDSIFEAENLDSEQLRAFFEQVRQDPVTYDTFAVMLNDILDSLGRRYQPMYADSLLADSAATNMVE